MRTRVRRLPDSVHLGLCALCFHLLCAPPCPAQGQRYSVSFAQGTHFFRRILSEMGLRPLKDMDQLRDEPETKLLIVLGDTELPRIGFNLEEFVRRGGAVLLATDRDCLSLLRPFGVGVVGSRVTVAERSPFAYKQSRDCIFIQRFPQAGDRDVPLFVNLTMQGNLSRVATNRPGYLVRNKSCELPVVATFPPGSSTSDGRILTGRPRAGIWPRLNAANMILTFAVGGTWGQGQILILSDHSVFINEMMWQQDIDNLDFAHNCVDWLTNGGRRRDVLFLEEGQVQKSFKVPVTVPPVGLPPLKTLVEMADKGLGELERDNAFNQAIHNAVDEMSWPPERWHRSVILTATMALVLLGLTRLSQARQRKEKVAPLAATGPAHSPGAATLFEQRQQAMIREGNLWEAARALARQGIESALGSSFPVQQRILETASGNLPVPALRGSWWRNWRFRRRFKRLWQLAYGFEPVRISTRRLQRLVREIEDMNNALDRWGLPGRQPPRV